MVKSLLARVADGGGSLLVLGDPGIGKSALVQAAIRRARDRGMRVLACAGAESEAHLSFAGLHQLLRPVLAQAAGLPAGQREALLTALGMAGGPAPAVPVVGLAVLELLGAGGAPVLAVAEDVHWLDASTCEVLAFVARRLGADPVGLLGTARDTELEGNPLALVELPLAAPGHYDGADPGGPIPLTRRLERAFASRLPGLAEVTLTVLLAAGLNDGDALAEALAAAGRVAGTDVPAADLTAAVTAGLAEVDGSSVRFRHPLVRSAVREAVGLARRQAMHRALAEVLAGAPNGRCGTRRRRRPGRTSGWPRTWRRPRAGPPAAGQP